MRMPETILGAIAFCDLSFSSHATVIVFNKKLFAYIFFIAWLHSGIAII